MENAATARSQQLDLSRYDTDKVANGYLQRYDPVFSPLADKEIKLLEIGIHKGGSMKLWRDYFPHGDIVGIDLKVPGDLDVEDRIRAFAGKQQDTAFLDDVAAQTAPDGFDIIIDDGCHLGRIARKTFWHLFGNHLRPGGIYVVEDWGTGYWEDWPDGRSVGYRPGFWQRLTGKGKFGDGSGKHPLSCHSHGMVGFVKQLVDEVGATDMTRGTLKGTPERGSKFQSVLFTPSIVFVIKGNGAD